MRLSIIFVLMILACQGEKKGTDKAENTPKNTIAVDQSITSVPSTSASDTPLEDEQCYTDVCLQLRNHDASSKSFEIYMKNLEPVAGVEIDFSGIEIDSIKGIYGGSIEKNKFNAQNNKVKLLAFSFQGKVLDPGEGILTKLRYNQSSSVVCMEKIIIAARQGLQLSNNEPECMKLN